MTDTVAHIVLPSVAPEPLHALLLDAWNSDAGTLAIQMVKIQVSKHETRKNRGMRKGVEGKIPSLSDAAMEKLAGSIGEDVEEYMKSMEGLPPNVLSRVVMRLENMPYNMFCKARQLTDEDEANIDEWVIRNEVWLRDASETAKSEHRLSKKFHRSSEITVQEFDKFNWAYGLVQLSTHADVVFPNSLLTNICRIITRPKSLPGFKILDGRRPQAIRIQPSVEMFRKTFKAMTDDILKGLDWENVFIAGGIVLGTLLCTADTETTSTPEKWKNSDIDLYIHGLGPVEANKKMEHIFSVFKSNLGEDAPVLVVRNSKTITFFSEYPTRRVQIVLKLVDSPKDVLLNFDLDVCAVGWDGEEVWMLPRAARALETGYTVFTMDLINGHYLGDRRATQEQRVFKYADRGFGIRILPAYLEGCQAITNDPEKRKALMIDDVEHWDARNFDELVEDARMWTNRVIRGIRKYDGLASAPLISHSALQERTQTSEDPPRRSVLSGLSLFMRHVALWEQEVLGAVIIEKNSWALQEYDDIYVNAFGISYNDAPDYSWDENFTKEKLIKEIAQFNQNESCRFTESIAGLLRDREDFHNKSASLSLNEYHAAGTRVQRITHASSLEEILQPECDIFLPVWLPKTFIDFADSLIPECIQKSAALPSYTTKAFIQTLADGFLASLADLQGLRFVIWRITSLTMWQHLNRTIDEVHEVLWSFHSANAGFPRIVEDTRTNRLVGQFGRRAIRMTAQDEYGEFARWVVRKPARFSNYLGPYIKYLSPEYWGGDDESDESDESDEPDVDLAG